MKKQMKQIALPLFLGGLIACSPKTAVNETDLLGNWTEILPPSSNFVQGMTLANRQGFYGIHLVGRITKRHPDF